MSADEARKSVPLAPGRATIGMNIKDLPAAASFTFEGAFVWQIDRADSVLVNRKTPRIGSEGSGCSEA